MRRILHLTTLLAVTLLSACTEQAKDPRELVIARVNGENVFYQEFLVDYRQLKSEQDEITLKNPRVIQQLKARALNEVIIMNLLRHEAMRKQLHVAKEEVESRLANWKDGYPPGGFEEMMRKQNTTEEFLKKRLEDQLLVEKMTESLFGSETLVSDDELKKYFKDHEHDFVRPERVHAFQIVVPTKEEADRIRQEISSGKTSFESAARQYSLSPDAAKGGDLGFFSKGEKIAAFNEAFLLSIGTLSKPIQSRYGIHLLKVVEKQPAGKLTFNDAKPEIVKLIKQTKEVTAYKEWVTKLLKDGEIYRNETLFEKS